MVGSRGDVDLLARACPPDPSCSGWRGCRARACSTTSRFNLRAGEIVGLAGLVGAGRTELCRALFGVDRIDAGTVQVEGKPVASTQSRRRGEGRHCPYPGRPRPRRSWRSAASDRLQRNGGELGPTEFLGDLATQPKAQSRSEYVGKLRIKCSSGAQLAGRLSGGNQQKVVIAKWLARGAKIFLFDEPTRGIDVGARWKSSK